jgi:hypothetical protein
VEDNKRLILDSVISDQDAVQAIPNDPQTLNTTTPADIELTAVDVNPDLEIRVASGIENILADNEILFLALTVNTVDQALIRFSNDTRLSSTRSYSMLVDSQDDRVFGMKSNIKQLDAFTTYVDMLGHPQPTLHHLLREGGNGFVTLENGNRILIL